MSALIAALMAGDKLGHASLNSLSSLSSPVAGDTPGKGSVLCSCPPLHPTDGESAGGVWERGSNRGSEPPGEGASRISNPAVPGSRPGGRTISTLGKGLGWGGLAIGHEVAKRGMFHFGATNSAHEPTGRV